MALVSTVWAVTACGADGTERVDDQPPTSTVAISESAPPTTADTTVPADTTTGVTPTSSIPLVETTDVETTIESSPPESPSGPGEGVGVSERITITVTDP